MKSYNNCLWDSQGELKCNFNKDKEIIKSINANKSNFIEGFLNPIFSKPTSEPSKSDSPSTEKKPIKRRMMSSDESVGLGKNSLSLGDSLVSSDGKSIFTFQRDGNAVMIETSKAIPVKSPSNTIISRWETGTKKSLIVKDMTMTLENNGNLVIRDDKNKELWNCCSNRTKKQINRLNKNNNNHKWNPPYTLSMNPNGILVIKDIYGKNYWWNDQDLDY